MTCDAETCLRCRTQETLGDEVGAGGSVGSWQRMDNTGGRGVRRNVRLTEFEDNALMLKAAEQSVSVQRLLVESALTFEAGETATERRHAVAAILRVERQLAAIGNNLNQIARAVNAGEPVEAGISGSLEYLRGALKRLDQAADVIASAGTGVGGGSR